VLEVHDHEQLADQLEIHVVELPRLPARGSPGYDREGKLADWGRFFRAADDADLEELAMSDDVFGKAREALDELSADPYAQRVARLREEGLAMYKMEMGEARRLGQAEGEARGKIKAERELMARQLEHRFGALSDRSRETIDQASSEQIAAWALRVLSASCVEDVFEPEHSMPSTSGSASTL
jgi:hypothetical protein